MNVEDMYKLKKAWKAITSLPFIDFQVHFIGNKCRLTLDMDLGVIQDLADKYQVKHR